jgi:hypothetical protein
MAYGDIVTRTRPRFRSGMMRQSYIARRNRNDAIYNRYGRLDPRSAKLIRGGGQGGGSRSPASSLASDYEAKLEEANAANEARYQDILGGYRERYGESRELLKGLGERERSDINRQYNEAGQAQHQDLVARGLSSSTVGTPGQRQVALGRADALGGLDERLRREQLQVHGNQSAQTLQFMERKTEKQPNLSDMIKLYNAAGRGGVGGGGGYPGAITAAEYAKQYGNGGFEGQYAAAMRGGFAGRPIGNPSWMHPSGVGRLGRQRRARRAQGNIR